MPRIEPGMGKVIAEPAHEVWTVNGRRTWGTNLVVGPEIVEQFRQGWRCLRCYGPQEEAFPDECVEPFCNYKIKDDQLRHFASDFQGEKHYGPSPDEFDDEQEDWKPASGIWVPKGIN